jgi:DNA-binding transcriptional regulator LsrR (DeoR family)
MAAHNRTSARTARTLHLQIQALELRRLGFGYREIAAHLGIGRTRAHQLVTHAMEESRAQVAEAVDAIKALEISRLDGMLRGLWPNARKGGLGAVDRVLKIMERRAKLLGLDAPVRISATNKDGDQDADPTRYIVPVPAGMALEEWVQEYGHKALQ